MRTREKVSIPASAVNDALLTDSEFRLLVRLSLKYGTLGMHFDDTAISGLGLRKSTFYRLLSGLVKREYLQRVSGNGDYRISVSKTGLDSLNNKTLQSNSPKNETELSEEERTKEEEKENNKENDSIIINNNKRVTENDKEKEIQKKEKPEGADRFTDEYREIIAYLNEKTGKNFSARSRVNQGHMSARLKEGFTVEDFKRVIDVKWFQWHDDEKMAHFLRPETLFGTKFDRYLNEEKYVMKTGMRGEKYIVTEEEMNSDIPF